MEILKSQYKITKDQPPEVSQVKWNDKDRG